MDLAIITNVITFLVLIMLCVNVSSINKTLRAIIEKDNAAPANQPSAAAPAAKPVAAIPGDIAAVIAGAIDSYMALTSPGVPYSIAGISPSSDFDIEAVAAAVAAVAAASAANNDTVDAPAAAAVAAAVAAAPAPSVAAAAPARQYAERPVWGFAGMRQNTEIM